eukprot:6529355-Prymnesium_polylepis.1
MLTRTCSWCRRNHHCSSKSSSSSGGDCSSTLDSKMAHTGAWSDASTPCAAPCAIRSGLGLPGACKLSTRSV